MNKKLSLKKWIKSLILESIRFDETYENYQIEVDDISIPGIFDMGIPVTINMDINYNMNSPTLKVSRFNSQEGIEIVNIIPVSINVDEVEIMAKTMNSEQLLALKKYISNYLVDNQSEIEEKILDSVKQN